jgi:predicted  nucleic acid-binding Zn ribbon protein
LQVKKIKKASRDEIAQQAMSVKPDWQVVYGTCPDLAKCFPFDFGERMVRGGPHNANPLPGRIHLNWLC